MIHWLIIGGHVDSSICSPTLPTNHTRIRELPVPEQSAGFNGIGTGLPLIARRIAAER
jgi:hypothetical protein